ncbi:hypothetical protein OCC47_14225 [Bacillus cereus]|uniref:hypothetical protein n=1 Tax=Bacillus cereus TaxID=1396 RepID=UPI003D2F7670|nr:hypothetical protein [Bacillus cereus]
MSKENNKNNNIPKKNSSSKSQKQTQNQQEKVLHESLDNIDYLLSDLQNEANKKGKK